MSSTVYRTIDRTLQTYDKISNLAYTVKLHLAPHVGGATEAPKRLAKPSSTLHSLLVSLLLITNALAFVSTPALAPHEYASQSHPS